MGRDSVKYGNSRGFTLIEALVAGGLLAFMAVAMIPAFSTLIDKGKATSFSAICATYVRAKMQEFVNGANNLNGSPLGQSPTGWEYTKYLTRTYYSTACKTGAALTAAAPGRRVYVGLNPTTDGFLASDTAPTSTDTQLPSGLKGFQLWVNLRRYNPRTLEASGVPTRDCITNSDYQFLGIGDGIEVTVTGMIRTEPAVASGGRGTAKFGNLSDLNATTPNPQLTCSLSQIIFPPSVPFRYYMTNDGKIRNMQNVLPTAAPDFNGRSASIEAHLRNIWSQDPAATGNLSTPGIGNILGFAVAPDNSRVYVLMPGALLRYKNCTYQDSQIAGYTFKGIPNCSLAAGDIDVFNATDREVLGKIVSIAVNFNMSNSAQDVVYSLSAAGFEGDAGQFDLLKLTASSLTNVFQPAPTDYKLPQVPRIKAIYIAQSFPQTTSDPPTLFVADNSCYLGPTGATTSTPTNCVTIWDTKDTNGLGNTISDLPLQVEAISY